MNFKNLKNDIQQIPLHIMLIPGVIIVAIYSYFPMIGLVMAFQKYNPGKGFFASPWVGFDNFKYVFQLPDTYRAILNTVFIASMKIVAMLIVPVIITLLLNEIRAKVIKRSIQTIIYLPHFLSWVILGGILVDILSPSSGIINKGINIFGFEPIFFLGDNNWFPYILIGSHVWKEIGYGTILYLAALTSIDPTLYEAAVIDGANRWKQTLHITIPGMLPIIILMTCLRLGNILDAGFDQVFNLYSPMVYESGDIIDTLVYRIGLLDAQYSVATAVGFFKSVISFILILISHKMAYKFAGYKIF